ncbi:MAG: alkaline phosphatase, partial [Proteobacteria bacterium]
MVMRIQGSLLGLTSCLISSILYAAPSPLKSDETTAYWMQNGKHTATALSQNLLPRKAKNVILFVGDGMGLTTIAAARILEGQKKGLTGEENSLSFENFPNLSLSKTYNTNAQVGDSAGTITAMMTGSKTRIGVIGVGPEQSRGHCAGSEAYQLKTYLESAEQRGLSTGIVTTTRITHATPAGAYAHAVERDWEVDSAMPPEALQAGCRDIARQLIDLNFGDGIDVILGGGRQQFVPLSEGDPEYRSIFGKRNDGRNLIKDWLTKNGPSAQYVWNRTQFLESMTQPKGKLLGLFEPSHMNYESDRVRDPAGEPSLSEMATAAEALIHPLKSLTTAQFAALGGDAVA